MMNPAPAPSGRTAATVAAYAAAIAAFGYALLSAYWALGGHGLIGTVGGYAAQAARHGGAAPVLLALGAAAAKVAAACSPWRWCGPVTLPFQFRPAARRHRPRPGR